MIESMVMIDSRGFRLAAEPGTGNASPSGSQGVCGVTGDPVEEWSIASVESMLCRGEERGGRSDVEVLHEGTRDLLENNEESREDSVVFVIVGERSGISGTSSPHATSGGYTTALR